MKTSGDRNSLGETVGPASVGRAYSRAVPDPNASAKPSGALRARLAGTLAPPVVLLMLALTIVQAFPPAPHHTFYGVVRDKRGNPIDARNAEVLLETSSGRVISTRVAPGMVEGRNYRLRIPMDSGLTRELYKPTAMRPMLPFRIRVRVGRDIYLPIEVSTDTAKMGHPGEFTQLDLTLGEDLDGDGIPDAWEQSLINRGLADDLASLTPDGDADGDGLSNLAEYLAASYGYDDERGFELVIKEFHRGVPVMEFFALPGRSYEVLGSADLDEWKPLPFRLVDDADEQGLTRGYSSNAGGEVEIEVPQDEHSAPYRFFKLKVN